MKFKWTVLLLSFVVLIATVGAGKVDVGLYVLNLGKYDISTGAFTADFYLSMKCEENCSDSFEFMNGRAANVDKIIDEPQEKFYRVLANLNSPVDLRSFPFDKQRMEIILEDKIQVKEDLHYSASEDETGIDKSIAFTGWEIQDWEAKVEDHFYDVYDETYSQYTYSITISRLFFNAFLKTFLPVLFIILILMCSFIMDPDKINTRITVATSSLVASVMFHISISNQIPPVGYLTIADKFMMLTYFILLAAVIMNVWILEMIEQKKEELAHKLHKRTEYSVFIVVPLIYILFFLLI